MVRNFIDCNTTPQNNDGIFNQVPIKNLDVSNGVIATSQLQSSKLGDQSPNEFHKLSRLDCTSSIAAGPSSSNLNNLNINSTNNGASTTSFPNNSNWKSL